MEKKDKDIRNAVIGALTDRHDLYVGHCAYRSRLIPGLQHIHFHKPFCGPVELYFECKAPELGVSVYDFEEALDSLIEDGTLSMVNVETNGFVYPCDFRDARFGALFLNVPLLMDAYVCTARLAADAELQERAKREISRE